MIIGPRPRPPPPLSSRRRRFRKTLGFSRRGFFLLLLPGRQRPRVWSLDQRCARVDSLPSDGEEVTNKIPDIEEGGSSPPSFFVPKCQTISAIRHPFFISGSGRRVNKQFFFPFSFPFPSSPPSWRKAVSVQTSNSRGQSSRVGAPFFFFFSFSLRPAACGGFSRKATSERGVCCHRAFLLFFFLSALRGIETPRFFPSFVFSPIRRDRFFQLADVELRFFPLFFFPSYYLLRASTKQSANRPPERNSYSFFPSSPSLASARSSQGIEASSLSQGVLFPPFLFFSFFLPPPPLN